VAAAAAAAAFSSGRASRQELQRLESAVSKSERMAGAVLSDLRSMRQNPRATELRSEVGSSNSGSSFCKFLCSMLGLPCDMGVYANSRCGNADVGC
jgi:hypothetical protein